MSEPDQLHQLILNIASVEGPKARQSLWAEQLRSSSPDEAAYLLDGAVRLACIREPAGIAAHLPLLDIATLSKLTGPGVLSSILPAAASL
jgi:hypothetical protein